MLIWWSGVVVSTLALINEVNLHRTRLMLRWMTVSGSIPGAGHLFQYVTNQPPKANSAFHPALEVRSRRGAIQIHVYLYLYLYLSWSPNVQKIANTITETKLKKLKTER